MPTISAPPAALRAAPMLPRAGAPALTGAALSALTACYVLVALLAGHASDPAVAPAGGRFGLLPALGPGLPVAGLLELTGAGAALYAVLLLARAALPRRGVWAAVIVVHVALLAGPILISRDVFSYVAYGRLMTLHGIDPYLAGPIAARYDAVLPLVGWRHTPSVYGPLFTIFSAACAPLGLAGSVWAHKLLATGAALGVVRLVGRQAEASGRSPARAVAVVGLNPIWLVWGVGGAHNDLVMLLGLVAALGWLGSGAGGRAAGATVLAAMVKASAGLALPFVLLAGRARAVRGALLGGAAVTAGGWLLLGSHALGFADGLGRQQGLASGGAFAAQEAYTFGERAIPGAELTALHAILAVLLAYLLWRAWRTRDWIEGAGWALLVTPVLSSWFLPWYTLWALPFAALARDRRLLAATLSVQVLVLVHALVPALS